MDPMPRMIWRGVLIAGCSVIGSLSVPLNARHTTRLLPKAWERQECNEQTVSFTRHGVTLLEMNDYEGAGQEFLRALDLCPGNCAATVNLGIARYYARNFRAARRSLLRALETRADRNQVHFLLGLVARKEYKLEEAWRHFKCVKDADPRDAATNYNLGMIQLGRRQYLEAADFFRSALEAEPENRGSTYGLAIALDRAGKTLEGSMWMKKFKTLKPANVSGHLMGEGDMQYGQEGRLARAVLKCGP